MGDVINLRLRRKQKARAAREAEAATNRAAFGRTKSERVQQATARATDARLIDGKRRAPPSDDAEPDA